MTLRARLNEARDRLAAAGIHPAEAGRDAALFALDVLGWDRARLLVRQHEVPPEGFDARYAALIERRLTREPVAYIRGRQEFWGRDFAVSPDVLIPRPETELIVEIALKLAGASTGLASICDVGTGSGVLAVTLAAELPDVRVVATDISPGAIALARANAERHGCVDRIEFREGEYFAGAAGPFDVIVANPPYVADEEYDGLMPEVRNYEPRSALAAGPDGLRDIRRILEDSPGRMGEGSMLLMEFGHSQSQAVSDLVAAAAGLTLFDIQHDLQRIPRMAIIERKEA